MIWWWYDAWWYDDMMIWCMMIWWCDDNAKYASDKRVIGEEGGAILAF